MKKFTLKKLSFIAVAFLLVSASYAQMPNMITMTPADATAFDSLTLVFDPALACFQSGSLAGLPSIAMHSGVTINNLDWQLTVVFNGTGANGQSPTFLPTGDGKFTFTYKPSDFYGITPGTTVTRLCMVFNNGIDWNQDGRDFNPDNTCKDIFVPLTYVPTTTKFKFNLNMTKAINDGIFDPVVDGVFVDITGLGLTELTDANADKIYDAFVEEGIQIDTVYHFKFRINTATYETVDRTITGATGTTTYDAWWNNEALGQITFQVDMTYQIALGTFNPASDFMDVAGEFNGWAGSPHLTDAGNNVYETTYNVDNGTVYKFKFRINGDWNTSEFPNGGPERMCRGTNAPITLTYYYDDYNPNTWPVIFNLDMTPPINDGSFIPATDFVDVAGTINGWGGHDVLFHRDWNAENVYTITKLVDKAIPDIMFKFRINGDWNTAEFPAGGPNRTYTVHDTTGGNTNILDLVYNYLDIDMAPYAYNVAITGDAVPDAVLTGSYSYFDVNGDPEGASIYKWYIATQPDGSDKVLIDGATAKEYTVLVADIDKYLVFEVTPVAAGGETTVGDPKSAVSVKVGGAGIDESTLAGVTMFPNPVGDELFFQNASKVTHLAIYNMVGQKTFSMDRVNSENFSVKTSDLQNGLYFIVMYGKDNATRTVKIVKR
jgi:hypothetical protein